MIMNGKELASKIKEELKQEIQNYEVKPGIAVIQIGNNEASNIYVNSKARLATEIGYNFLHFKFEEIIAEDKIIEKIKDLNNDNKVNGIIVQLPIPKHLNEIKIINTINPLKDIDGLTRENVGALFTGSANLISCTPKGIIQLLNYYNVELKGKHVVIVGRSNLVGKPLISLCLTLDATVTICHSKTKNLTDYTKTADVLISAVGKKGLITSSMIKKGAVVVDVGINRFENKIFGDVDYDNVSKKASLITPVPGGVGPMTTISLMKNVLISYNLQNKDS